MLSLMLLSSSKTYQSDYLEYCISDLRDFLAGRRRMLFVPFAYYKDFDGYTDKVRNVLGEFIDVVGAHQVADDDDLSSYDAIFCGGGNTFLLLSALYQTGLLGRIRRAVTDSTCYVGSSAGANVACPTISTTNDMPIVCPPSFEALNLVPFNINPHYYERPAGIRHVGESRRDRILEFQEVTGRTVVALKEGAILIRSGDRLELAGISGGIIFRHRQGVEEVSPGDDVSRLLLEAGGYEG